MLTEFGKALRKIRIDRQELLKEMADALGVSSAYLSAVETGKRRIPDDWVDRIVTLYSLDNTTRLALSNAADKSTQEVKISLLDVSDAKRDAILTFAKALDGLSDDELTKIMSSMKKRNKGRGDVRRA